MRVENWNGDKIRFVEVNGEWYAVLKDICYALDLKTFNVAQRLDPRTMEKVQIDTCDIVSTNITSSNTSKKAKSRARKTQTMIVVNEQGIYQALFASRRLEARKFQMWTFDVLKKLRKSVGLEQYEVMRMTDPDIQDEINCILDTLYWDDEKKCVMQSVTVQGGDVEQVVFSK